MKDLSIAIPGGNWCGRAKSLPANIRARLAERAVAAPLFAHAYAFHLNLRFGGMTPPDLAKFAYAQGLAGIKLHVSDGEDASLDAMSQAELGAFGELVSELGLELHVETSTTAPQGLSDAVQRALAVGAVSLRCYPRYEGRVSEIIAWTIDDLRRLRQFDPSGRLRITLEQHEDLTSDELTRIVDEVANPNLSLLFDFANMLNAYETPLAALKRQAAYVTDVHVKDCFIRPDRGGWGHLACPTGHGDLPVHAMLIELLLLGEEKPQVLAFGLEEEEGYFAPALRWPQQEADPFIAARSPSFTDPGPSNLADRLKREAAAAHAQVRTVRSMLEEITMEARRLNDKDGKNGQADLP
ncbi:MAG: sugar phosphate isomerase/epimerase family protein [Rhizobiaceae bacterium]